MALYATDIVDDRDLQSTLDRLDADGYEIVTVAPYRLWDSAPGRYTVQAWKIVSKVVDT